MAFSLSPHDLYDGHHIITLHLSLMNALASWKLSRETWVSAHHKFTAVPQQISLINWGIRPRETRVLASIVL